jgi:aspartyl protease/PDZ domain-containing protein
MRFTRIAIPLLLVPALLYGQHAVRHMGLEPATPLRFELSGGREEVSIPFRTVNRHLLIPVMVHGKGPFQVILDTGMPIEELMLYDNPRVASLGLTYLENVQAMVVGAGGSGKGSMARIAEGAPLAIGDLQILDARITVLPTPPGFGAYHDGVIGAALFRHFAVSIDNDRSVLTLRRPEAYRPPEGAAVIPLIMEHGMQFLDAKVRIGDGDATPVRLVVDLGASHAVSLNESKQSGIRAPERSIATAIGRGVSGQVTGRVGRIRSLEIGGVTLTNVVATFPDREHHSPRGMDSRDGNLGSGVLGRFNVTFDYAGKRVVLKPSGRFAEPFEWNMSGIQADPTEEGSMEVRQVLARSPAAEAHVRVGDRVVKIDGESVSEANYYPLWERMKDEGRTVVLELRRGEKLLEVSLKLRRLV